MTGNKVLLYEDTPSEKFFDELLSNAKRHDAVDVRIYRQRGAVIDTLGWISGETERPVGSFIVWPKNT